MCAKKLDNENTCQRIGNITPSRAWDGGCDASGKGEHCDPSIKTTNPIFIKDGKTNYMGNAKCRYPLYALSKSNDSTAAAHIRDLKKKIEHDKVLPGNSYFVDPLMENVCTQLVDNRQLQGKCMESALGKQPKYCSNFFSTEDGLGRLCMGWLDTLRNRTTSVYKDADTIMADHCANYPTLDECSCIYKESNEVYKYVESLYEDLENQYPATCWFKACHPDKREKSLIPDSILKHLDDCPDTVCQNIQDFKQGYSGDFDFDQYIDCSTNYSGGGDGDGKTNTGGPGNNRPPNVRGGGDGEDDDEDKGFFSNKVYIYVIVAIVFFIIVGVGIYFVTSGDKAKDDSNNKKKTKTPNKPTVK